MAVYVSMLRAVNVGGNNRVGMERLRTLCRSLGFEDAQTLLQSGNVVFRSSSRSVEAVGKAMEEAIEAEFGFRTGVFVRTPAELRTTLGRNPFPQEAARDPSHLLVMFLAASPDQAAIGRLATYAGPEKIAVVKREAWLYYPNGIGRSKLTNAVIEKNLGVAGTARNWNTVTKLLTMAEALTAA